MISNMKSKSVLSMEVVPNEMLVDKVLKIILKSKKDLKIESIQLVYEYIIFTRPHRLLCFNGENSVMNWSCYALDEVITYWCE